MEMTVASVMAECRNFFCREAQQGRFAVCGGEIRLALDVMEGQYVLIRGSVRHDGVFRVIAVTPFEDGVAAALEGGGDEEFSGVVCALAPPKEFLSLAEEIGEWIAKQPSDLTLTSERFAGYSYTRAAPGGLARGWQEVFCRRLNPYRRMFLQPE